MRLFAFQGIWLNMCLASCPEVYPRYWPSTFYKSSMMQNKSSALTADGLQGGNSTRAQRLNCDGKILELSHPRVMGILNVTPDSFSDGGRFDSLDTALNHAQQMLESGADIIDVGGESTRPGADDVGLQQEIDRVAPVIEAIVDRFDTIVSIDTSKPEVMKAAHVAGAGLINDVRALQEPGALEVAAGSGLAVCLMHMQGKPRTMQAAPEYDDVVQEVTAFLRQRRDACINAGIESSQIVLDPGFGFGKTLRHNLALLARLDTLCAESAVLIGLSRKRMLGEIIGDDSASRETASVAAALFCVQRGASIVRVHDVEPTVQALAVYSAVCNAVNDRGSLKDG